MTMLPEWPETHARGRVSVENADMIAAMDLTDCDLGVQIGWDGRVWLCINGMAWIRFKPRNRP